MIAFGLLLATLSSQAAAQSEPELAGPVRKIARSEIVFPAILDPLMTLPVTPNLQASLQARGADVTGTVRAGLQAGDTSYNVFVTGPLNHGPRATFIDRRSIPLVAYGFDVTNIIWQPKASAALSRQLGTQGFLTSSSGQPLGPFAPGTTPTVLNHESDLAVARAINSGDAVHLPFAVIINAGYKYGTDRYNFFDLHDLTARSTDHLSDEAHVLGGVQFLRRTNDPGYFVAFTFNYSSLFYDTAMRAGAPTRIFGTFLRVEMRRPFATTHLGFSPSLTYEPDTKVKTVETAAYWWLWPNHSSPIQNIAKLNAGFRIGYQQGRGGAFASVFVGGVAAARQ